MFTIRKPDDFHIHLRQGELLPAYVKDAIGSFNRLLIMPNTVPPINTTKRLEDYMASVNDAAAGEFTPLYTVKLAGGISVEEFTRMADMGISAAKYYPRGATTNAEDGVAKPTDIFHLLEIMQERDIVLCIHGEDPDAYVLRRESAFLPVLISIREQFPGLRIVLEHISTAEGIETVRTLGGKTAGTITVHHIMRNLNDLLGGFLNPHLFCKPVLKHPEDQAALMDAAFGGEERFFLGTDSAPHQRENKECDCGCAGTYTAPVAIPALFEFFQSQAKARGWDVDRFENFCSVNGARFYGLPLNDDKITLVQKAWQVPAEYHGVVPFLAGKTLEWSIA